MMWQRIVLCVSITMLCAAGSIVRATEPARIEAQHVRVFSEPGQFGGWPANHGIWCWGDEILVGFSAGTMKDLGDERHNIDRDKPERHWFARSLDGGQSWKIEDPSVHGVLIPQGLSLHGTVPPGQTERPWRDCPGNIDFHQPDFAMTIRMTDNHIGPSRFYYSYDRGHTWNGPFRLPNVGTPGIAARTDYLVTGKHEMLLFVTAGKSNHREGRPLCMKTVDGGKTFEFVSWIGDEPSGYAIMPSTIRISKDELLCAVRCREGKPSWIDCFRSLDNGLSWKFDTKAVPDTGEGNPPAMIRLRDGRICLTYGVRRPPFGMRARLSDDDGRIWHDEIHLRDDGGGRDVGYPRTVQRSDGKLVTVYYFHDSLKGDRYIAATIWSP